MATDNVEIVRGVYARWSEGDMSAGVDRFDPEIAFESYMPDANERLTASGPAEVEAFMRDFLGQWQWYRLLGDEFLVLGDEGVLVRGRQAAIGRQSGVEVEMEMNSVWRFREGSIVRLVFEPDWERARAVAEASGEAA